MKNATRNILLAAALATPLVAIEPPVQPEPIPPQAPPVPVEQPEAPVAPAENEAVPMPEAGGRPYLGVILDPVPDLLAGHLQLEPGTGVVVGDMVDGGPAAKGGLAAGDVVVDVEGEPVGSAEDVRREVAKRQVGDEIELGVIQGGKPGKLKLVLEAAPEFMLPQAQAEMDPRLEGFLDGLPENHAELLREALEQNMNGLDELNPADDFGRRMMERLQREMGARGGMKLDFDIAAQSSIRLLDEEGTIELNSTDGRKEAKVYDHEGTLLWEGPYDTEQDKAAVPDGVRERLEKLDFDMDFEGNGMRLKLGPNRFRPFDELEDDLPEEEVEPAPEVEE